MRRSRIASALHVLIERPEGSIHALDGLRGVAVTLVLLFHCALFPGGLTPRWFAPVAGGPLPSAVFRNGWAGVDIFFVLSGFLLGRILIRNLHERGRLGYPAFFIRRFFRIIPAYYFVLTLSLLVFSRIAWGGFPLLLVGEEWAVAAERSWTNYLFLNNYLYPGATANLMSWCWSLCIEEHFYILLPPLLWLAFRLPAGGRRVAALLAYATVPTALRLLYFSTHPDAVPSHSAYFYSHLRFDEMFVGVLAAYLVVVHPTMLRRTMGRLGPAGPALGGLCIAIVLLFGGIQQPGAFTMVWQYNLMSLGTVMFLLWGVLFDPRRLANRVLGHPLWIPVARVSYGAYLLHPFVIFAILGLYGEIVGYRPMSTGVFLGFLMSVLMLTNLAAAVMFVLLEAPLLRIGRTLSKRMG